MISSPLPQPCVLKVRTSGKNIIYVVISDDIAAREALVALGPGAAAVTTSSKVTPDSDVPAVPVPKGTAWIHLTLEHSPPSPPPSPAGPSTKAGRKKRGRSSRKASRTADAAPVDAKAVAAALSTALQQPQRTQCEVLASCLSRVSEGHFASLRQRVLQTEAGFYDSEDFPGEIVKAPSLRAALVAGFAPESTWLACEKAAVLDLLLQLGSSGLFSQIGLLALVRCWHPAWIWRAADACMHPHSADVSVAQPCSWASVYVAVAIWVLSS